MSTRLCLNGTNKTEPLTHKHTSVCCGVNKYSVLIYTLLHNSFMLQVNRKSIKMVKENSIIIKTPFVNTCACVCTDAVVVVWQLESWVTQTVVGAHGVLTGSISTRLTLALVHIWTQTTDGQLLWTQTTDGQLLWTQTTDGQLLWTQRPQTVSYYEHRPQTGGYYEHRRSVIMNTDGQLLWTQTTDGQLLWTQTVSCYEHRPQTVSYYEHRRSVVMNTDHGQSDIMNTDHRQEVSYEHRPQTVSYYEHRPQTG